MLGYTEAEVDRIERDLEVLRRDEQRRCTFEFALRISRGHLACERSIQALRDEGYTLPAVREIGGCAALTAGTNRVTTMLALPVEERALALTKRWYFKLIRSVIGWVLPLLRRLGDRFEAPLAAEGLEGPFAPWIARLTGTPLGALLRDVTRMWVDESSALALRTKLLILTVVAQGLSCDGLVDRARRFLLSECEISKPEFKTAVAHLQGETVTEEEERFLELARESIRYETRPFQRTIRDETQHLSRAKTLDLVGTLALSNALARLRALRCPLWRRRRLGGP